MNRIEEIRGKWSSDCYLRDSAGSAIVYLLAKLDEEAMICKSLMRTLEGYDEREQGLQKRITKLEAVATADERKECALAVCNMSSNAKGNESFNNGWEQACIVASEAIRRRGS